MAWRSIVHSAIGTRHQQKQLPCQDFGDYLIQGNLIIGAVADGAGSAKHAEIGAKLAVEATLAALGRIDWSAYEVSTLRAEVGSLFRAVVQEVVDLLRSTAELGEYPLQELGCTLLAFVATPHFLASLQIGDGFIVVQEPDSQTYQLLFEPIKGEFINETVFVTSAGALDHLQYSVRPHLHPFVCAATDGLEKVAIRFQNWEPFPPFFQPFVDCLQRVASSEERQVYLRQFLDSERLNARTDDDKTLLVCLYGPEESG
ncbi:MAG: protein phosphatase 2C domain-containing protein [Acaryochloridaceae cyanobacterium CSU_5_19]|nr:protein phosphatase 2C domain-containing protein [Acaryochloridaceae cyanobacterium CSU_5_19]